MEVGNGFIESKIHSHEKEKSNRVDDGIDNPGHY